jgi:hypothetical protein
MIDVSDADAAARRALDLLTAQAGAVAPTYGLRATRAGAAEQPAQRAAHRSTPGWSGDGALTASRGCGDQSTSSRLDPARDDRRAEHAV